jgi:hypothetical protein
MELLLFVYVMGNLVGFLIVYASENPTITMAASLTLFWPIWVIVGLVMTVTKAIQNIFNSR